MRASVEVKNTMEVLEDEKEASIGAPGQMRQGDGVVVVRSSQAVPRTVNRIVPPRLKGLRDPIIPGRPVLGRQRSAAFEIPDPNHRVRRREARQIRAEGIFGCLAMRFCCGDHEVELGKGEGVDAPAARRDPGDQARVIEVGPHAGFCRIKHGRHR